MFRINKVLQSLWCTMVISGPIGIVLVANTDGKTRTIGDILLSICIVAMCIILSYSIRSFIESCCCKLKEIEEIKDEEDMILEREIEDEEDKILEKEIEDEKNLTEKHFEHSTIVDIIPGKNGYNNFEDTVILTPYKQGYSKSGENIKKAEPVEPGDAITGDPNDGKLIKNSGQIISI